MVSCLYAAKKRDPFITKRNQTFISFSKGNQYTFSKNRFIKKQKKWVEEIVHVLLSQVLKTRHHIADIGDKKSGELLEIECI